MKQILKIIITLLAMLFLNSCGGGTSGTGGTIFVGKVVSTDGSPISNSEVIISNTGDVGQTNSNGEFIIETNSSISGDIEIIIETEEFSTPLTITNLPSNASKVTIEIEIDKEKEESEATNIEIEFDDSNNNDDNNSDNSGSSNSDDDNNNSGNSDDDDNNSNSSSNDDHQDDNSGSSEDNSNNNNDGDDNNSDHGSGDDNHNDDNNNNSGNGNSDDDDNDDNNNSSSGNSNDDNNNNDNNNSGSGSDNDNQEDQEDELKVEGIITAMSSSSITVQNIEFIINDSTEIKDEDSEEISILDLQIGDNVKVEGVRIQNEIIAEKIEIK